MICENCFHRCKIQEGGTGLCTARSCRDGKIVSLNYGQVTALAVDPIEKKPFRRFFPGSRILSLSSWGCNMQCPWCQNDMISRGPATYIGMTPEEVLLRGASAPDAIGVAYTYNEPTVGPEFVLKTAALVHEEGKVNALITNGMCDAAVWAKLLPVIDAYNIDLKTIDADRYLKIGGNLAVVQDNIRAAAAAGHVELTTLIVPDWNDTEDEMRRIAAWIASVDPKIPLHVTRFFPAGQMRHVPPTDVKHVYRLAEVARAYLEDVYVGNC